MHPDLTAGARAALRALPVDPLFILEHSKPFRELLEKGIVVEAPGPAWVLTLSGARQLLALLVEEEMAAPCRCGLPRSAHSGPSPHDAPESHCRAFTPSTPVYTKPPSREGGRS